MTIEQLVPAAGAVDVQDVLSGLSGSSVVPFSAAAVECCERLSRALLRDPQARAQPAMVALGYWLRPASTARLASEFGELERRGTLLMPRGLVFHVPPANVEVMFVYSLAISLLVGNRNIVRVSRRRSPQMHLLCRILDSVLAAEECEPIRDGTRVVSYGHEPEISTPLSLAADVRVIWGGDETVAAIRALPAKPGAKDLAFADRFSLAAIDASAYLELDEGARDALAGRLFNDAYWFDQMACSSPRLVVWTGSEPTAAAASTDLWPRVHEQIARHGYRLPLGALSAKLAYVFGAAIDRPLRRCTRYGNELSVLSLESLEGFDRAHVGAGTFFECSVASLRELASFVVRKDQTLSVFGQSPEAVSEFVLAAGGRGIDRIVEVGEALAFGRFWDGYDLLAELTRTVAVDLPAAATARVPSDGDLVQVGAA